MRLATIRRGSRPIEEFVEMLQDAGVGTLVDVRRFARSRRHPHFNRPALAGSLEAAGNPGPGVTAA